MRCSKVNLQEGKVSQVKVERVIPGYEIKDIPCGFCSNSFSSKVGVKVRETILLDPEL